MTGISLASSTKGFATAILLVVVASTPCRGQDDLPHKTAAITVSAAAAGVGGPFPDYALIDVKYGVLEVPGVVGAGELLGRASLVVPVAAGGTAGATAGVGWRITPGRTGGGGAVYVDALSVGVALDEVWGRSTSGPSNSGYFVGAGAGVLVPLRSVSLVVGADLTKYTGVYDGGVVASLSLGVDL